ncbi:peroxisomal membrane anchor protein conserved region-domain-containing protein [Cantharellus anzutake]|uniref:peroxisomal membrane anchor protein conserved region-domain-containing protein n=1 Tax=Cantharellus anzutake TaxID=1750568 RepID=UPI0019066DEB|nr:peroxisomal membrane anchor protein conserved region-domain-containing protein [Cantharellus anzutake]KAF8328223.1 peroxisomal membrane anchor protein conserved region-domain-containing protein [Cantharellus anzutake]
MADRQELIRNALAFLGDPSMRQHPITQKIAFLESKGLTNAEIEQVLAQSANTSVPPTPSYPSTQYGQSTYAPSSYNPAPLVAPSVPERDWRDYFIMAVVSGGVMYGVMALARKYLFPHLKPPSSSAYEADRDALTAQFDAAAAMIKDVQSGSTAARAIIDEECAKVDAALETLQVALNEGKEAENKTKAELREIRDEVNNVRDMLPKMLEKHGDAQSQALVDLQQELKSLKALLLSRSGPQLSSISRPGSNFSPAGGSTFLPTKPTIPSWQLTGSPTSNTATTSPPIIHPVPSAPGEKVLEPLAAVVETPPAPDKGKGKEDLLSNSGVLVGSETENNEVVA